MFLPRFGQELSGEPGAPSFHVRIAFLDALHGFFEVLPFSFEIGGHLLVNRYQPDVVKLGQCSVYRLPGTGTVA
jgi:hypothetical protein